MERPAEKRRTVAPPSSAAQPTKAAPRTAVLFERHDPEATGTAPEAEPIGVQPASGADSAGASSSNHGARGLQRRSGQAGTADGEAAPATAEPQHAGISTSADTGLSDQADGLAPLDMQAAEAIPDRERTAPHLLSTDLDLHLNRDTGDLAARARVTVRNSGTAPLLRIILQLSSALRWQSATLVGAQPSQRLTLQQHGLTTDADHTGTATEAEITLPAPLAPGAEVTLDLFYGGKLSKSGERLERLGAPASRALASDWDAVTPAFVGLRGFGNVLWYPVAARPASLAAGDSFARATEEQRSRGSAGRMSLRLTLESSGPAPEAAFLNSRRMPLAEVGQPAASVGQPTASVASQVAATPGGQEEDSAEEPTARLFTAVWPSSALGSHLPSLFVSDRPSLNAGAAGALLHVSTTDSATADRYAAAAQRLRPFLEEWLGPPRGGALEVLELPADATQPFADGGLLLVPGRDAAGEGAGTDAARSADELAASLVEPLASAAMPEDALPWLAQGLPEFLRMIYLERQEGRDRSLAMLNSGLPSLQQQEALTSAPLRECASAACARTKAVFAFAMLRQIAGDDALKGALPALLAAPAGEAGQARNAGQAAAHLQANLQRISGKDLHWFFDDWFDHDKGLPALSIVTVSPRRIERGTVHTVVPTERRPVGGPVGPEPVAQPGGPLDEERPTAASRNSVALPDGSWLVAVEVRNDGDATAEIPVTVRSGSLQNTLPLRVPPHGRATVRVPFETAPDEVVVNDGTTPEQRGTTHRRRIEIIPQAR